MITIDIDYRNNLAPDYPKVPFPTPIRWRKSDNNGFHFLYESFEQVYKVIIDIAHWNPGADRIDIIQKETQGKNEWSDIILSQNSCEFATLRSRIDTQVFDKPDKYKDFKVGDRLSKEYCPSGLHDIEPDDNPSVVIYEDGIHCFRCGKTWKWCQLNSGYSEFEMMVKDNVHWDQIVFALLHHTNYLLPVSILKKGWEQFVKFVLKDEYDRVEKLTKEYGLIRDNQGNWCSKEFNIHNRTTITQLVKQLPYIYYWHDPKEKPSIIASRLSSVLSSDVRIGKNFPTYDFVVSPVEYIIKNKPFISKDLCNCVYFDQDIIPKKLLASPKDSKYFKQWLQSVPNFPLEEFKVLLGGAIAAKFEELSAIPPIAIVTGASGSGKTLLSMLVNYVMGTPGSHVLSPSLNPDEWFRSILVKLMTVSPAIFGVDEFNKYPERTHKFCLSLARKMTARMLYSEERSFDLKTMVVFIGTQIPSSWMEDLQIQRRCFHIYLGEPKLAWTTLNINLDTVFSDRYLQLSAYGFVVEVFNEIKTFGSFQEWLKIQPCVKNLLDAQNDTYQQMVDLLNALQKSERDDEIYSRSRGWITIHRLHDIGTEAHNAWSAIADAPSSEKNWFSSDWLSANEINFVLKLPYKIKMEIKKRNNTILAIRFTPSLNKILEDLVCKHGMN